MLLYAPHLDDLPLAKCEREGLAPVLRSTQRGGHLPICVVTRCRTWRERRAGRTKLESNFLPSVSVPCI